MALGTTTDTGWGNTETSLVAQRPGCFPLTVQYLVKYSFFAFPLADDGVIGDSQSAEKTNRPGGAAEGTRGGMDH